jgi:hypothetical protein
MDNNGISIETLYDLMETIECPVDAGKLSLVRDIVNWIWDKGKRRTSWASPDVTSWITTELQGDDHMYIYIYILYIYNGEIYWMKHVMVSLWWWYGKFSIGRQSWGNCISCSWDARIRPGLRSLWSMQMLLGSGWTWGTLDGDGMYVMGRPEGFWRNFLRFAV